MESKNKIKLLNAKITAIVTKFNSLLPLAKKVSTEHATRTNTEFLAVSNHIEQLWQEYSALNDECNSLRMNIDPDFAPSFTQWAEVQEIYSRIQECRESLTTAKEVSNLESKPSHKIKLPPLTLKSFDGLQMNWPAFYESFRTNVHENSSLSDGLKIQYLFSKLEGKALQSVSGIAIDGENYSDVWDNLVTKYQDRRALGNAYLKNIFDSKTVPHTADQLNSFVDNLTASISALQQLKIPDLTGFIFSHLACRKLDSQIVQAFELTERSSEIPTYDNLVTFLRQYVKVLERSAPDQPRVYKHPNKPKNSSSFVLTATSDNSCVFCKKLGHFKLYECPEFKKLETQARFNFVKKEKYCFNCLSTHHRSDKCKSTHCCKHCHKPHHSLLCLATKYTASPKVEGKVQSFIPSKSLLAQGTDSKTFRTDTSLPSEKVSESISMHSHLTASRSVNTTVLLSTAQVYAVSKNKQLGLVRCLIDSGSQNNLITLESVKRHNLEILPVNTCAIKTVGSNSAPVKGMVNILIRSRFTADEYNIKLLVVGQIVDKLPAELINVSSWAYLEDLPLADRSWSVPGEVDIILGAQLFPQILLHSHINPPAYLENAPTAIDTTLGYILMGEISRSSFSSPTWSFGLMTQTTSELNETLTKFWELEEVSSAPPRKPEDVDCENIFMSTVTRCSSGRFSVALPFKHDPKLLGNSYQSARRRYLNLEHKFKLDKDLRSSYNAIIIEYLSKGYLSELPHSPVNDSEGYFIPHRAVVKPDRATTKTRVVMDASAPTYPHGISLNDCLHTGPNLQADLFCLLLNFRLFPIALSSDIQQMYLRILINNEHRKYQKILFRFSEEEEIRTFQFNSVVFGISSSPYLAMRTIKHLANTERHRFPDAASVAEKELYMDDLTTSVLSVNQGIVLSKQLIELFALGGFNLVKWSSNSQEVMSSLPDRSLAQIEFTDSDTLKILGLKWSPISDNFCFSTASIPSGCTKRIILSLVARFFDVLGLVAPVVLYAKILIQELWLAKIGWDDIPPDSIVNKFELFKTELPLLSLLAIPRHVGVVANSVANIIGFGDASLKAFGAVVYLHVTDPSGIISFNLVTAKSKVAPLKTTTLARLELCAALLLTKLIHKVYSEYNSRYAIKEIYAFSDSTIALSWIHSSPHKWQIFVANRVSQIQELLTPQHFFHINGVDNPSDCLSRGLLPSQIADHPLWWKGPSWASTPIAEWPIQPFIATTSELSEVKKSVTLTTISSNPHPLIYSLALKVSSWSKLLRIVVYILRFVRKLPRREFIETCDLNKAESLIILTLQKVYFCEEFEHLKRGKSLAASLRKLDLFIDEDQLIRIGGRLSNSLIPFNAQHPILLPRRDHIVNLIIDDFHQRNCHTGANLLMSLLRQKYWILSARSLIRQRIRSCNFCFKISPRNVTPIMADLPSYRVQESKAFLHTGLDFAGPINITLTRRRGIRSQKAYICLFICLATKGIHIELVSDLSTDAFLNAFNRFISRRGSVSICYSDNGTNFIGAKRKLDEIHTFLLSRETQESFRNELNKHRITWKTIPPRSPHFGGIWESNIKSIKSHLYRVIGNQILCYEELLTVLTQIECLLNSRPLCLISEEPHPEILTPAHFLMSSPIKHFPASEFSSSSNLMNRKRLIDQLVCSYWKKWRLEYLHTLQSKQKWNTPAFPMREGLVVLVHQDNAPPLLWPLGRIETLHPGKDGIVRVATIRTKHGLFKRPVVKLCPLPSQ